MRSAVATVLFSSLVFFGSGTAEATSLACPTTGCLTIRVQGDSSTLNTATNITRNVGDTVMLEFVVDTNGNSFEGYGHQVAIAPTGMVSTITFSHQTVSDASANTLTPDFFGPFVIGPDGVSNVNQAKFGTGLAAGTYVVDSMSFLLTQLGSLSVTAAFGEALNAYGLGGSPTSNISFFNTNITVVPEPSTGLLLATGLLALGRFGRRLVDA